MIGDMIVGLNNINNNKTNELVCGDTWWYRANV